LLVHNRFVFRMSLKFAGLSFPRTVLFTAARLLDGSEKLSQLLLFLCIIDLLIA
jgi:hypothetical protein